MGFYGDIRSDHSKMFLLCYINSSYVIFEKLIGETLNCKEMGKSMEGIMLISKSDDNCS
jgi:hypothetical protein